MKEYVSQACREWERSVFALSVVAVVATSVLITGLRDDPDGAGADDGIVIEEFLIGDRAFAFMVSPEIPELAHGNPFLASLEVPPDEAKPAVKVADPKPAEKKPEEKPAEKKPEAKPAEKKPEEKPAPAAAKPAARLVTYHGTMTSPSGKLLALVRVADPAAKTESVAFYAAGAEIEGVKIERFDRDRLAVIDPKGRETVISFSENKEVLLQ